MALYKITLDEDAAEEFAKWESLPLSKKAGDFLTSVSTYIELPTIEDGYWKLVDRIQEQKCTRMFPFVYMMQKIKLHI